MITSLRIRNFKAWRDTKPIRFAPLTVFFGANSSGKTSLHQLLLMLKQTQQSPDRQRVLHLGDNRTLVDLGTIRDVLHGHDDAARLGFEVQWTVEPPLKVLDSRTERQYSSDQVGFDAEIGLDDDRVAVKRMGYHVGDSSSDGLGVGMEPHEKNHGKFKLHSQNFKAFRRDGRKWELPPPVRFYGFPDEAIAYYQNTGFLPDLAFAMESLLGSVFYVGPLREYPKAKYLWSGEAPEHVGENGARAVEALLAARQRRLSQGFRKRYDTFDEVIARWLKAMGLIASFRTEPIAEDIKEYRVLVRVRSDSSEVRLTDVGFGVSQILPVLVECFYVPARSVLIFEQPEIHLHPRVQAALADLFIDAIHCREDGRDRQVQIIVESHSEHFLRRLQRRIAEDALKPHETALYFSDLERGEGVLSELNLDLFGNITNWPHEFFGDEMGDLAAMVDAAARRQEGPRS
jgi:predicted ATPase